MEPILSVEGGDKETRESGSEDHQSDAGDLEIDFTGQFALNPSKSGAATLPGTESESSPALALSTAMTASDPCGFCQDGTPCSCAQMEQLQRNAAVLQSAPAMALSRFTPPPADGDVGSSMGITTSNAQLVRPTLRNMVSSSNPCAGGPGTCDRCQVDSNSTLFCKSLAAMRSQSTSTCVGSTSNSSTNKSSVDSRPAQSTYHDSATGGVAESLNRPYSSNGGNGNGNGQGRDGGIYLSCEDTYVTLSRHPYHREAMDDMASWLGKLKTILPEGEEDRRPAMEIEAASVMTVFRFWDRRIGRK